MERNPLSDKIITDGDKPFKLWLEFEVSTPRQDLENDFANIAVNILDGRQYGINVWTFNFLNTARKDDLEKGLSNYLVPPDLFVKELTRSCIEQTIVSLLFQGNLEEVLNTSIFGLDFLDPYCGAMEMEDASIESCLNELKTELPEDHILSNASVELIARKTNNDDIILELENGNIAVVHLTWKGKTEMTGYPFTRIYKDKMEFWHKEMRLDIVEFKE